MKRFRWTIVVLFLLIADVANADSIPTFNITSAILDIEPGGGNQGFVGFNFAGPGISIFERVSTTAPSGAIFLPP